MCLSSFGLAYSLLVLADAFTPVTASSPYPLNFITVMGFFFIAFYIIARVVFVIPLIRYIPFAFWAVYLHSYPQVLLMWEELIFYPFWGSVLAYAQGYTKRYLRWRENNPRQITTRSIRDFSPRKRSFIRRFLSPRSSSGRSIIAIVLAWIWRSICNITYFTFIFMPVRLIRLGFWVGRMIPQLRTGRGWWTLFIGIIQWIWHLFPFAIRYEFEKHKHGKDFKTAVGEEMMASYLRGERDRRKREEEELRRAFSKAKRYFRRESRAGRSPYEERQQRTSQRQQEQRSYSQQGSDSHSERTSSSTENESEQFWGDTKKTTNSGRAQQQQHKQSNKQSTKKASKRTAKSSHWKTSDSSSHNDDANNNTKAKTKSTQQSSKSSQGSTKSQQSSQKSSQNNSQQSQSRSTYQHHPKPQSHEERNKKDISRSNAQSSPLSKTERHILSKPYYDEHLADFTAAGWTYEASESNLDTSRNPITNLGLNPSAPTPEAKKRYRKLSQKYQQWARPIYPSTVTDRANLIIRILNDAGSFLRKKK